MWHTEKETKSASSLESLEPRTGERLDGAILYGTSLEEVDWFAQRSLIDAHFDDTDLLNADLAVHDYYRTSDLHS